MHAGRGRAQSLLGRSRPNRGPSRTATTPSSRRRCPTARAKRFYRNVRAAAESGWDFSSRWMRDPADLRRSRPRSSFQSISNSLLYDAERTIAALQLVSETARRFRCRGAVQSGRRARGDSRCSPPRMIRANRFFYDVRWRTGERVDRPSDDARRSIGPVLWIWRCRSSSSVAGRLERDFSQAGWFRHHEHPFGPAVGRAQWLAAARVDAIEGVRRYGASDIANAGARSLARAQSAHVSSDGTNDGEIRCRRSEPARGRRGVSDCRMDSAGRTVSRSR